MIETVFSVELAVGETLLLQKNRISGGSASRRVCVVTGTHGDELEGQYVAYRLAAELRARPELLDGIVDIYPAINPLGINSIHRSSPLSDLDMNRLFPGNRDGNTTEAFIDAVVRDIAGADVCIDIHASNIFLTELPQVRINENAAAELVPRARRLNMPIIWVHSNATVLESTLAYSLNALSTPTLVVEMGVGMRVTPAFGEHLVLGILHLMDHMGMWGEKIHITPATVVGQDRRVAFLNAESSGIFIAETRVGQDVKAGDRIGYIADPVRGELIETVAAPVDGLLFTIREYPVVYEGSLMARILESRG
ncbi:MAG: succinylglutamate desuccinylase/aspartoacylase family protein [Clostridiales Family XIII bacterium]|jgi:predicted deacylase|nr:succinylglutamate desuccinylase/aspartoacylase family protein [Clostridiales Family XIII bacterium]